MQLSRERQPTFLTSIRMSLGHLSFTPPTSNRSKASHTDSAAANGNHPQGAGGSPSTANSIENVRELRGGAIHRRSSLPLSSELLLSNEHGAVAAPGFLRGRLVHAGRRWSILSLGPLISKTTMSLSNQTRAKVRLVEGWTRKVCVRGIETRLFAAHTAVIPCRLSGTAAVDLRQNASRKYQLPPQLARLHYCVHDKV